MPRPSHSVCVLVVTLCASLAAPFTAPFTSFARGGDEVKPLIVQHSASIDRLAPEKPGKEVGGEKVIAEIGAGSIEFTVDAKAPDTRIDAEFTVDGTDEADVERRSKVVKLFAQRVSDGTIVVQAMFPGKAMERDSVKVSMRVPSCSDSAFKSGSGAIIVTGAKGSLHVSTKSGSIKVSEHTGGIDAVATTGTIAVTGATEGVRATSTSGTISVSLAVHNDHPFDLESKSGAITIEVDNAFDGAVRMTTVDGAVALVDPSKRARLPVHTDHTMTAEVGAAATQSLIESSSGALTLVVRAEVRVK